jgi:hypothetical protein
MVARIEGNAVASSSTLITDSPSSSTVIGSIQPHLSRFEVLEQGAGGNLVGRGIANNFQLMENNNEIMKNMRSAGSGNFVPHPSPMKGEEIGSSNPRVLSDMGLAIPRPTRLGDPRNSIKSLVSCIRLSLRR